MDKSPLGRPEAFWASRFSYMQTGTKCLRNKSVLWTLGAFLLFVIFSAVRNGAADLFSGYARNEMYAWSTSGTRPAVAKQESVARALGVVRLIAPGNPDPHEDLARLALVRSGMPGINDAEKDARLVKGLLQIRRAITLRPVSSYSWATLLLLKREHAEYDAEFRHALERAVTLGPWELDVQRIVAEVGMSAWDALPRAEQEMVRENMVRGMRRQAAMMISIAQARRDDCSGERAKLYAGCSQ